MRIALLSSAAIVHTARWANALAQRGHEIHVISAEPATDDLNSNVPVHRLPFARPHGYYLNVRALRRVLARIDADILHTHFASGNGTLGRLSRFQPQILSVWGADVFDFPRRSFFNRKLVVSNLRAASHVCSTSEVMARQTRFLCPELNRLTVVPFGVDMSRFVPQHDLRDKNYLTIGTVKRLLPKYGIDTLISGFARARHQLQVTDPASAARLRLRLVGDGQQRNELEALVRTLGLDAVTTFVGAVSHRQVPEELNRLDVYAAVSRLDSESFGVAVVEASACALPVVVSDVGGLPEVVRHGRTGIVVPRENPTALAGALVELARDEALRHRLGEAGRRYVGQRYDWPHNVSQMEAIYARFLPTRRQAA